MSSVEIRDPCFFLLPSLVPISFYWLSFKSGSFRQARQPQRKSITNRHRRSEKMRTRRNANGRTMARGCHIAVSSTVDRSIRSKFLAAAGILANETLIFQFSLPTATIRLAKVRNASLLSYESPTIAMLQEEDHNSRRKEIVSLFQSPFFFDESKAVVDYEVSKEVSND